MGAAAAGIVPVMLRAHLSSHPLAGALALAAALVGAGCNSDDLSQVPEPPGYTTAVDPTEQFPFTTGEPNDTSSGTTMIVPPPWTCRDALLCLTSDCLLELGMNPSPEPDLSMCKECVSPLTTEEWLKIFHLGECVGTYCAMQPECTDGDPMKDTDKCRNCVLLGMGSVNGVPGCEGLAMQCK